ncbi:MAG: hypothetical protein N2204_05870, partial [Anaerolineae bacterium]|nr:hypothetical protein [Anaerolineae bacterium]
MKRKRFAVSFAHTGLGWPDAPALLAWLLPVFAWAPLAYPGYPELHSGFLPVFNLVDFAARWGEWGWMPLIGRPFDPWRGEGSLPYALAALFRLAGMSPGDAIKLVFAAGLVAGSVGMYRWARSGLGPWPALVAALAYVYWPMGLAQVLVRGALAEAVLLGLLPWVLQAAQHLRNRGFSRHSPAGVTVSPGDEDREVSCAVALALGIAAVLWTQAGLGLWLAGLLVGWWLAGLGMGLRLRLRLKSQADAAKSAEAGSRDGRPGVFLAGWAGGLILGLLGLLPAVLRRGWG